MVLSLYVVLLLLMDCHASTSVPARNDEKKGVEYKKGLKM